MVKITLIALSAIISLSLAQTIRYRPTPSVSILTPNRYNPQSDNSGRYNPDNSGKYSGNDGRYRPDNSGQYSGNDGRYRPDNSGQYYGREGQYKPDDSGRYNPDGSGRYSGQNGNYQHDGSGVYSGQNEKYYGDKYGSNTGKDLGVGSKQTGVELGSVSGIGPATGFGTPVNLKVGSAAGKYDNRNYAILRQQSDVQDDGYHYLYETENGITGEEQGKLHHKGTDAEAMHATGFFTYTGPDNVEYTVRYTADENGFVPEGSHLPTPPPIPEAILRSLEWQKKQGTL